MEKLFLDALLAGKEVDVVNEQDVHLTVALTELRHGVILNRVRPDKLGTFCGLAVVVCCTALFTLLPVLLTPGNGFEPL